MSDRPADTVAPPPRLPRQTPEELGPEQTALYRSITDSPRQQHASFFPVADEEGVLSGPYRAMLLSPEVGSALERLGSAVRYRSRIPAWARELTILTVACHCRCEVEWQAHEQLARASGVPDETIETLDTDAPVLADRQAEITYAFVAAVLRHQVPDAVFADAESLWSKPGVFELVTTVGYYQIIAGINEAFDVSPT